MKSVLTFVCVCAVSAVFAQELSNENKNLLERAQMEFTVPKDLQAAEPIENRQMNWEFAYKHPEKKFEVRYAIRPLDEFIKEYETFEKNKKEGDIMIHPNNLYSTLFDVTILNISGGNLPESTEFDAKAVKKEFGADWGATVMTPTGEEFGQGYAYTLVVALHKDNVADAYIFFMGDDSDVIVEQMDLIFHALRFK